jgi:hypothetical protein
VVYCPNLEYMTAPAMVKTNISETVTATRTFGNSLGSRISAMKEGSVIWPLLVRSGERD